jgi:hypothetical protein
MYKMYKLYKHNNIIRILVLIIVWVPAITIWAYLFQMKFPQILWKSWSIKAQTTLPKPIIYRVPYEYCQLGQDAGLSSQAIAGTPVPRNTVSFGPIPTVVQKEARVITSQPLKPTPTIPVIKSGGIDNWQVDVADTGETKNNNFNLIVIGVGYSKEENEKELIGLIKGLQKNFSGVNVNFVYARQPIQQIKLGHIDQQVDFSDKQDYTKVLTKIHELHPADGVLFALKTPLFLGTSRMFQYAIFSSNDPNGLLIATHETGHVFGLGDGYDDYYPPRVLPNSELFYLDEMPRFLSEALSKLPEVPPLYEMGTCNGRRVYTFYEPSNNIMGNYNPQAPNSWGDSIFTPLQIKIMNNYIKILKGGN